MPPRHVRSYSDFYRHGRRVSPVAIKKKPKLQKVRHFSDTAILSVSRKRSRSSSEGINWSRIKRWAIASIVLGWIALPLYTPYFRVKDITFENFPSNLEMDARIVARDTIQPSWFFIPRNNYFIVKTDEVTTALSDRFHTVENITVTKKFPNQLVISAVEKAPALIYDDGHDYYFLDQDGNKLRQIVKVEESEYDFEPQIQTSPAMIASSTSSTADLAEITGEDETTAVRIHTPDYKKIKDKFGLYPIIYDNRKNSVVGETSILSSSTVKAVLDWNHWMVDTKQAAIKYFVLDNKYTGLTVVIDKPWVINFDPGKDIVKQFTNFKTSLQNSSTPKPKQYIDLRYSDTSGVKGVIVK